jgi:hypothetical protein
LSGIFSVVWVEGAWYLRDVGRSNHQRYRARM